MTRSVDRDEPLPSDMPHFVADAGGIHDPFPLTEIQCAYWLGRNAWFNLGNIGCHVYFEFDVPGVERSQIQAAWQKLIDRHEMLRAIVTEDGTQQILVQTPHFELRHLNLQGTDPSAAKVAFDAVREQMSHRVFSPRHWPSFDLRTTTLDGRTLLHFSLDLLFVDLWSLQILFNEFTQLLLDPDPYLAPLEITFRDYQIAMSDQQTSGSYRLAENYWLQRLDTIPPAPQLPLIKDPSAIERPRFIRHEAVLQRPQWERLKRRATDASLTPSGLLLAAFARVLAMWSQTDHFTLNMTLFQRTPLHPDVHRIVGDFTTVMLLEVEHDHSEPFETFAKRIAARLRSDLEHRDYSGLKALQQMAVRGRERLWIPVVFTSALAQSMPGWQSADLWGELKYGITQTPQVYLDHQAYERGGRLHVTWDVVEELFDRDELAQIFSLYADHLRQLAEDDGAWKHAGPEMRLPPAAEPRSVEPRTVSVAVDADVSAEAATDTSHLNAIEAALRRHPIVKEAEAVETDGTTIAYVVARPDGAEPPLVSRPAPWSAGPLLPPDLRLADASLELLRFVADVEVLEGQATIAMTQTLGALGLFRAAGESWRVDQIIEQHALQPHYHGLVERWLKYLVQDGLLIRNANDTFVCVKPDSFSGAEASSALDHGLMAYFHVFSREHLTLLRGETKPLDLLFGKGTWGVAEALYETNPLSSHVNQQAARVVQTLVGTAVEGEIRVLEVGAGIGSASRSILPMLPADRTRYQLTDVSRFFEPEAKCKFEQFTFVEYGVLDALGDVLAQGVLPYAYDLIVAANLLHNAEEPTSALAQLRTLLAPGGVILLIEATRNTRVHAVTVGFLEGLSKLSHTDERPFLSLNRWREMLHAAGFGDVEIIDCSGQLASDIGLGVVVARTHGPSQGELETTVARMKRDFESGALEAYLNRNVPQADRPRHLVVLDTMPRATDGTLDRLALPRLGRPATSNSRPSRDTEIAVERIWAWALGRDAVSADDNFMAIGGDSLIAVRIVAEVRDRFQIEMRAEVLFEATTIRKMAAEIDRRRLLGNSGVAKAPMGLPSIRPEAGDHDKPFPLTDIQQAYWIGRSVEMELGGVGAHFYLELERTSIDRERFEQAWQCLIERHGMLRTIVLPEGKQKLIDPAPRYQVELRDLTNIPSEYANRILAQERERMSHRLYSGEHWPPFELLLTKIGPDEVRLHLSFDLLIMDLWSLRLLMRELLILYDDPRAELPALDLTFRDYVLALVAFEKSDAWLNSFRYWQGRLKNLAPAPDLPLARTPGTIGKPRFTRRSESLSKEEWFKVKNQAERLGLTGSSVLIAAFAEVLAAWSRTSRFTINLTLFQRVPVHSQVNQIIGDFTSTILFGIDWVAAKSFSDLARAVQTQLWRDIEHTHVSGVRVLREAAKNRNGGPGTVMPVVFTSGLAQGLPELERLERMEGQRFGTLTYSISQTPQVWLDHQAYEQDGVLQFNWDSVDALFPPRLLDDMFAAYCGGLRRIASDHVAWTDPRTSWISPAEIALRAAVNDTAVPIPSGLLQAPFLAQVRLQPSQPAVATWDRHISYEDLYRQVQVVARRLRELGVTPNRLVAIVMEKGWEQVVAVLAILEAGGAYLPIDPELPEERRWFLLHRGDVEIALTQPCLQESLSWPTELRRLTVSWSDEQVSVAPMMPPSDPRQLAYVIFTSGSTGEPKGVMVDHQSALNTITDINQRFGVGPDDRVLALSSLSFDLSVYDIFGTLAAGGTIVIPHPGSRREPSDWAYLVRHERVTIWNSVPALLEMLVDHLVGRDDLSTSALRLALLSGDWIPVKLPERAHNVVPGLRVISLGGATEASIWSIFHPIGTIDEEAKSIPYGRPLLNQEMHVLNESMQPCPTWTTGEIYIGGVGLAQGYWKDKSQTDTRFIRHPKTGARLYRTGDLGRYLPSADIEFLGREDDQVKIQGFRIELSEIEMALERHPKVSAAVVLASEGRGANKHLVAYVVAETISIEALSDYLRQKLPSYMVPNVWETLDAMPLTANGKVNRKALPKAIPQATVSREPPAPATADSLEQILTLISEELQNTSLRADDNLLDVGANSLDLVRITARLEREFGFRPSLEEFFRDPTAAALSRLVSRRHASRPGEKSKSTDDRSRGRTYELILEPQAREDFHREMRGLRTFPSNWGALRLPHEEPRLPNGHGDVRRSVRRFLSEPIELATMGAWLADLRQITSSDGIRHAYGSAGGCYPVQTYLHFKEGSVAGCALGTYYYHPGEHSLVPLTLGADIDAKIHEPFTNRPIFEQARFSLFLVGQPRAIEPIYGDLSERFSILEAGAMAHALECSAPRYGLGLCAIGWLEFSAIRDLLHLEEGQDLLHAHVGGLADASSDCADHEEGLV